MNVLVTGGAGFIGSHLIEKCLKKSYSIVALDNLSTGCRENLASFSAFKSFQFVEGSVLDTSLVNELVEQVDLVYHLAAAVGVRLIVEKPVQTITTNIIGTENILAAAEKKKVKLVLASTSEIYGKSEMLPFKEDGDMLLGPTTNSRWSYACSKAIDEFLGLAYWKEKRIPVTIARLFNTIGPRQVGQYGMVVPRFVNQALKNEPITVYGSGKQTRVFCDVEDSVEALIAMGETDQSNGQIFNLGGLEEISIKELAQLVKKLCQSESEVQMIPYEEAYEAGFEDLNRRVPDIEKAEKVLHFVPKNSLEMTLNKIINYIKK